MSYIKITYTLGLTFLVIAGSIWYANKSKEKQMKLPKDTINKIKEWGNESKKKIDSLIHKYSDKTDDNENHEVHSYIREFIDKTKNTLHAAGEKGKESYASVTEKLEDLKNKASSSIKEKLEKMRSISHDLIHKSNDSNNENDDHS